MHSMASTPSELARRRDAALAAIQNAYETEGQELGVTLFVHHHLKELDEAYWQEHCGFPEPSAAQVLDLLVPQEEEEEDEEEEDALDLLDFTLPGEVTNYLICVSFDEDGNIAGISMES